MRARKPWFRQERNMYFLSWNGKQIPLNVPGPDTPENREKAAAEAARICAGATNSVALGEAVAQFLARVAHRVQPETLRMYRWFLGQLVQAMGADAALPTLTPHAIEKTSHRPKWSPSTRHDYLGAVGTFLRDAGHALKLRRPPQPSRGADSVWTASEFDRIYGAARGDLKPLLLVLRDTGARPSEVAGLTVEAVDWEHRLAKLKWHKNAGKDKSRVIHFPESAWLVLSEQKRQYETGHLFRNELDSPFKGNTLHVRLARARERAGVARPVSLYGLRHSFICRALALGLSADKVAAFVGNSPIVIAKFYSHIGQDAALMKSIGEQITKAG